MKLSTLIAGGIVLSLWAGSAAVAADDNPMLNYKWRAYAGAFNANVDSKVSIHSDFLPEIPPIDVEDLLGVEDSKTVGLMGVEWRIARRHMLALEVFKLNRSDTLSDTYNPPIQIGDFFIEAGQISTSYDTDLARLTYGYSLVRNERSDLQLLAGIHVASLQIFVNLAGAVCSPISNPSQPPGCPAGSTGNDSESVTAPLPHLGITYTYAITPTIAMNVAAKGFAIELDAIDGSLVEIDADLAWQPFKNIGFGAGVRYFDAKVDSKGSDLNGSFEFEYVGPVIYVQATF